MRERLTYRFLVQLLGALFALFLIVSRIFKFQTLGRKTLKPDDLQSLIGAVILGC